MTETTETVKEFGPGPQGIVRRWLKELELAEKREKDYRDKGRKIWDRYRGKGRKKNSFNILWSNTETLAPAVFNSPPQPDVRRRFKDRDPVGKVASQVLERCLEFQTDNEPFVSQITLDVLDMLLPGRGVSRVRYVPSLIQVGTPVPNEEAEEPSHELMEGDQEELAWEQVVIEHVNWADFLHGEGKTWAQVPWIAFQHHMDRAELVKLFGQDIGDAITLDEVEDEDIKRDEDLKKVFSSAKVWEIWCKEERKVYFVCRSYKAAPLKTVDDPLRLQDFWPTVRPLMAIPDSDSLAPISLWEQYREQADELDRISTRINKIVDALKLRGVYDSTVAELSELFRGDDNDLIPSQDARAWTERGGIEKAIWMMPIAEAAQVLQVLYQQREATKQVIYEITGIADVLRGSTDPNETLGAQQLKAKFGSQRVQRMQGEVQRYVRDLIRLMAEIAAERFQPETLLRMTQMQIPTQAEAEMQAQKAAQQGQQPPQVVTLEQVMQVLRDDATRSFKVDVETDSMIAATLQDDMQGMSEVLGGISQLIQGLGPAVQAGAVPIEVVKELIMTICRRSRLGSAVEDALEQMKQPQPQADPAAAKAQAEAQRAQMEMQHKAQMDQAELQHSQAMEQQRVQADMAIEQQRAQSEERMEAMRMQLEEQARAREFVHEQRLAVMEQEFQRWKAMLDADTKIEVAHINADAKEQAAKERPKPATQ